MLWLQSTVYCVTMSSLRDMFPLLALVALAAIAASLAPSCPTACRCAWQTGHRAALCSAANFTTVPDSIDSEIQVLDLSLNHIENVHAHQFHHAGLVNLQRLNLSSCHVQTIHALAFHSLDLLVSLDLSHNELTAIVPRWFEPTPRLRHLRLDGNHFTEIEDRSFAPLVHLRALLINDCHTSDVDRGAFTGLESSLQLLELNRNKLKNLDVAVVASLQALGSLELADNPWECTCTLKPLRDWMNKQYIVSAESPVCASPERHASHTWDALDEETCGAGATGAGQPGQAGQEDVRLVCEVRGGGGNAARLRWTHDGRELTSAAPAGSSDRVTLHTNAHTHTLTIKSAPLRDARLILNLAIQNDIKNSEDSPTRDMA